MTNSSPDVDIRIVFHHFIRILLKFEKKNYLKLWKWFTETLNFQENFWKKNRFQRKLAVYLIFVVVLAPNAAVNSCVDDEVASSYQFDSDGRRVIQ